MNKNKPFTKVLKRSALAVALGMCFVSGQSFAQSSVGSIYGDAGQGGTVTIENLDTGSKREIAVGDDGRFTLTQLAPGRYKVSAHGVSRDVQVSVGTGTRVDLGTDATTLETLEVTAGTVNPIDVASVESTTIFSAERVQKIPVARDITNVALLAPGTVKGDTGFGNLASFGGSSVAENGYYINGFDVTNIRNFISYAELPFEAIAEQQIKTGGYGAEYGRSLGGVIGLVTKRGTNEWKGGVSAYWTPSSLRSDGKDVTTRDPDDLAAGESLFVYRSDNEADSFRANIFGGGPIIKDRLFFFGLLEGVNTSSDTYTFTDSTARDNDEPNGLVKLDWNITDNHIVEVTGIRNKTETKLDFYQRPDSQYGDQHEELADSYVLDNGGNIFIGKYTGYLTDTFTLSAQYGKVDHTENWRTTAPEGEDCPAAYDSRPAGNPLNFIGCWNEAAFTVTDRAFGPDTDEREAYRIDAEWLLGDHLVRFGYDDETFTSGHAGATYSGGIYYRYFTARTGRVNGVTVPNTLEYVRVRDYQTTSSSYDVINTAAYLEDSWQITDTVLAYGGLRMETFDNRNGDGVSFVEADNLIAPRLGVSWDVRGDSTLKLFGNAGRYFIPIASNTNIRASGAEVLIEQFFPITGIDPVTGAPIGLGTQIGGTNVNGSLEAPNAASVASNSLEPMYQDEFIIGAQWQLTDVWTAGVRGIRREVRNGVEDFCSHDAITEFVQDRGFADFDGSTIPTCIIMNPGRDLDIALDVTGDGDLQSFSIPSSVLGLPDFERNYNAVEVFWEANSDAWFFQGSYTWGHSYGNIEGSVNSTLEQDDAGLTQDFDHPLFQDGSYGNLPNDRRHTLKAFGSYELTDQWRVGGNVLVQSGRPVNCNGFVPLDGLDPDGSDVGSLAFYGASSFYCRTADGGPQQLTQRGQFGRTPWTYTFDASASYSPAFAEGLTFQVDVFNLFNTQRVTEYSEQGDLIRADETISRNFLNDVNYQAPRAVRFSVRYEF